MSPSLKPLLRAMTLPALALLLTACAAPQPLPPVVVRPPLVPPLPLTSRQPERAPICTPTCSQGLERLLLQWEKRLSDTASPVKAASEITPR